ncbi:MAG: YfiR family protein [Proteobacteria bacterium]|nr:YfiR family protein [Pseudomonadota bacterium]
MSLAFLSRRAFLAGLVATLLAPTVAGATEPDELKAVFLLRFLRYVEYETPPTEIHIRVIGAPEVARALTEVSAKLNGAKPVVVQSVGWSELNGDLGPCTVLYLRGEGSAAHSVISSAEEGTLIVGDHAGLIAVGAAIGFFWQNDKLRFDANQPNAKARGVRLGAELMRLARAGR